MCHVHTWVERFSLTWPSVCATFVKCLANKTSKERRVFTWSRLREGGGALSVQGGRGCASAAGVRAPPEAATQNCQKTLEVGRRGTVNT